MTTTDNTDTVVRIDTPLDHHPGHFRRSRHGPGGTNIALRGQR